MCVVLIWLQMYLILEFGEKYIFSFIFLLWPDLQNVRVEGEPP